MKTGQETDIAKKGLVVTCVTAAGVAFAAAFIASATVRDELKVRDVMKEAPENSHELIRAQAYKNQCADLNTELSKTCIKVRAVLDK